MPRPYRFINVERRGDVFCVHLLHTRLEEPMIHEMFTEIRSLVTADGCRKLALSLGPEPPDCLYSVFLAKLISLQRLLRDNQGELIVCDAKPIVRDIFAACCLDRLFHFLPDPDAAAAHWTT